jgi:poly(A) polymerase
VKLATMDKRKEAAISICRRLQESGHRALLAGGCVRDLLLGRPPQDYDIATDAKPQRVAELFEKTIGVGAAFGVQLVVLPEGHFEVATFRKDGPYLDGRHPSTVEFLSEKEDAMRRDFTINAMFLEPETNEVVDYVGGKSDLERKVVRAVGDPRKRFEEDHLRQLRAVRFAARFQFNIDPGTMTAIRELKSSIHRTSAERIRDEVTKMLCEGAAKRAFELLDETGLLEEILPEISAMKGVEQPPDYHPEGDVFTHTLLLLEQLNGHPMTLAYGALLHDVGKPPTKTVEDRIRFNAHDAVGAKIARSICNRFHMSNEETYEIVWLVAQHMRLGAIQQMREAKRKRFVREAGFPHLLELCRMDCMASHRDLGLVHWVEKYMASLKPEELRPTPLITGEDLIRLGYPPGPLFAEIKQAVEDAQLEGTLRTRGDAEAFVAERWKKTE